MNPRRRQAIADASALRALSQTLAGWGEMSCAARMMALARGETQRAGLPVRLHAEADGLLEGIRHAIAEAREAAMAPLPTCVPLPLTVGALRRALEGLPDGALVADSISGLVASAPPLRRLPAGANATPRFQYHNSPESLDL